MPEFRKDPLVGRWVIVAKNRADRPQGLAERELAPLETGPCPFCEGNEAETPGEVAAYRQPGTQPNAPGWSVRVVPNKFPALGPGGHLDPRSFGMYDAMQGVGAHEVIIESPRHLTSTTELDESQLRDVLSIYRERLLDWKQDPRLVYGMLFKNVRAAAGASLAHTHSQLIVMPIVPVNVIEELAGSRDFYARHRHCVFCDMIAEELAFGERMVLEVPGFAAFCPFAARFPFETWIVPTAHASHYETLSPAGSLELARAVLRVLRGIEAALDRPAYNYMIHTAPFDTQAIDHYHWHIEIIPRVTATAGFEWGTGFYINPVPPEDSAVVLRELARRSQARQEFRTKTTG